MSDPNSNVGMHRGASSSAASYDGTHLTPEDAPKCIPTSSTAKLFNRKNIRARFHDYSGGTYFITICTADKKHYFGEIHDGEMHFSKLGKYADNELLSISDHYPYAEVVHHVVMPNHIHAVVQIISEHTADAPRCIPTIRTALGVVVGGYKQAVTRFARRNNIEFDWQKRFHDHIVRGTKDGNMISGYISNNVSQWDTDCFNDAMTHTGASVVNRTGRIHQ